ncbi:B12-binding domain-containing radical SAM protein [Archaeoglobales archaeon]|nr:MAG: B12-binding domain-containing radical SAM protein [Archaeoglobales archaeon]
MIALINPNASVEVVSQLGIATPPLGLGYLASTLRERGFKVRIIDDLVERLEFSELIDRIKDALIVGITSTTPTFNSALKYACSIKKRLPDVFIILGGVHATFMPHRVIKSECVDAVCVGEGEYTLAEVAERMSSERSLKGVKGLIYKENGMVFNNGKREFIEDLDALPFPAFDLMPLEKYTVLGHKLEQFPMITSRGCPFGCRYCSSSLFLGRKFRARSPKNVVDEIEWLLNDFGARHIAFGDDTFTLNRKRVIEICNEIIERKLDVNWSCSSRVDTISPEMLERMKMAGCVAIYYGVESASSEILKYYRKRIDLEKVKRAVKLTKKAGIETICSFIIGSPFERREDIKKTLKFAIKLNPDYAQFSVLTPYPGTEIYYEAKEKGLLLTENFDNYTAGKPVLKNIYMSPQEIIRLLRYCYLRFYLSPRFIWNQIKKKRIGIILDVVRKVFQKN